MSILLSALAFIVLLTLLILIHELGHYAMARLFGVTVEEFGFGLPPRAKTMFRRKGTTFTLNWIPFGGFVRLKGENALTDKERFAKDSFGGASFWGKCMILLGGVAMNTLLALFILTIGFSVGRWVPSWYNSIEQLETAVKQGQVFATLQVEIVDVAPDGNAASVSVPSDVILEAIDGAPVYSVNDVPAFQKGKTSVVYTVRAPDASTQDIRVPIVDGTSGIVIQPSVMNLSAPLRTPTAAFTMALQESAFVTKETIKGMGDLFVSLFTRAEVPEGIAGVVGIAVLTHGSVQEGFLVYLRLVALLSLSLAILNVLPLPALDGGRLMFVLMEGVIRRPLNRTFELTTNSLGFLFLLGLIVVITVNDIFQLF